MSELVDCLGYWRERRPAAPALELQGRVMSYEELDRATSAVAATMRAGGVGPGDLVAVCLPKSIEGIVAVYAALKCGAAYVPVDPTAPVLRINRIVADSGASCLVTRGEYLARMVDGSVERGLPSQIISVGDGDVPASPVVVTEWERAAAGDPAAGATVQVDPDSPAYVLYTSGSTGTPKGVTLTHRNALAFVGWAAEEFRLRPDDRVSSHAPLHFDLSTFDVFATARCGGCVCLIPESHAGIGAALNAFVVDRGITVWYSVPNALVRMLGAKNSGALADSRLRVVLFAGEVFPIGRLVELHSLVPQADFYNLYGPTETNVCTFHRVRDEEVAPGGAEQIPIGRPCPYATTFLLDALGRPVEHAPGQTGELCVAGDSVMLGYLGEAALTEAAMVTIPGPDAAPSRAYRTGDLVRVDADLNYVFSGRHDDMVKVRGHRVELGEIESVVSGAEDVEEVACIAVQDDAGEKRIEAYVVPKGDSCEVAAIRRHCLSVLPRYLIPAAFHVVPALPRTGTGKIDRRALAADR